MRVIDLLGSSFDQACYKLADIVVKEGIPEVVIGVLTGGGVVGRAMIKRMNDSGIEPRYLEYKVQRSLTKKKESTGMRDLLPLLPRFATNLLIRMEVATLEFKSRYSKPKRFLSESLLEDLESEFQSVTKSTKVLIVDDCIDTGATIKALLDAIQQINPALLLEVAVITTTHKSPLVDSDYTLFRRTICRFPWSMEINENA